MLFKGRKLKKAMENMDSGQLHFKSKEYEEALNYFKAAEDYFSEANDSRSKEAKAYWQLTNGFLHRRKKEYIEAMKYFGRSNVTFSTISMIKQAKRAREEQGKTQLKYATMKANQGEFQEAARLYDAAGAVFQMAGKEKDAALARAKSNVQRAASVQDVFDKVQYLKESTKEFKKAKQPNELVEAHYHYYRGKTLVETRAKEAINCFAKAADLYKKTGSEEQLKKVKTILEELVERAKIRPATMK